MSEIGNFQRRFVFLIAFDRKMVRRYISMMQAGAERINRKKSMDSFLMTEIGITADLYDSYPIRKKPLTDFLPEWIKVILYDIYFFTKI